MNIDPRVMKELLQLQLLNKMSLISGDASSSGSDDFSSLLQTVMAQANGQDSDAAASLTGAESDASVYGLAAASKAENGGSIPSALYALNKAYTPLSLTGGAGSSEYDDIINEASSRFGVDPSLVKAVIHQESDFNTRAVSSAGAKGLMQLMDGTGKGFGVTNPFDPEQNVHAGTHFLSNLIRKYNGNEGVALAAYNAGPGRVDRLGIRTDQDLENKLHLLPRETQAYVNKVLGHRQTYSL